MKGALAAAGSAAAAALLAACGNSAATDTPKAGASAAPTTAPASTATTAAPTTAASAATTAPAAATTGNSPRRRTGHRHERWQDDPRTEGRGRRAAGCDGPAGVDQQRRYAHPLLHLRYPDPPRLLQQQHARPLARHRLEAHGRPDAGDDAAQRCPLARRDALHERGCEVHLRPDHRQGPETGGGEPRLLPARQRRRRSTITASASSARRSIRCWRSASPGSARRSSPP